jgi:tetratricopeptide (TPR) repeat protein
VVVSVEDDRVAARVDVAGSLEDAWFEEPSPPTDAEDHRSAARSAAERGLFGDAVSLWSAFLARVPDDLDARLGRGIALQELGDFSAAAEDLAYAVALAPGAFAPVIALADLSFFRKDYDESIIRYDAALRIDPGHAMALCRRGLARFHLRDWRAAAADLEAARATDPSIPQIDTYIRLARQGIRER